MPIIDDKDLQRRIKWTPHKNQQIILDGARGKRNVSVCAGVRFGKSALCGYEVFKHLLCDNQRIWIVSLSYDMSQKVFKYVTDFAGTYDKRLLRNASHRPPQRFEIPEFNSFVECKSIENVNSLLGEEINLAIFDEASRFSPDIYERYIAARLASRQGKLFSISTPFGKNWFFKNHLKADASFNFTTLDNPYFPKEEWESAKKRLPEQVFKQEYEASFLDDAASVFRGVKDIISDDCLRDAEDHRYFLGVDLGKHEDFTVLTVLDKYTHKVVYHDRFRKIDWNLQKERIIATAKTYNNARIIIDSTGLGDPISDDLKHHGLLVDDFKISGKSKQQLIDKLSIFIQQKGIEIPPINVLVSELESYGYQLTDAGNVRYSAPQGMHDDCVISLALAVWGLFSPKTKNPNKFRFPRSPKKKKPFQYD